METAELNTNAQSGQNPIRKVVTMLQNMKKKVEEEGAQAEKMYKKFMCYCKNNQGLLEASVKAAGDKLPQLASELDSAKERYSQLDDEVKKLNQDVKVISDAIGRATSIREKESAEYKAYIDKAGIDMDAVNKATAALVKGMGSSFLQSAAAAQVQKAANNMDIDEEDKQKLLAFLAGSRGTELSPSSSEIVGILKELARSLEAAIGHAVRAENRAIQAFEELTGAKKKELSAAKTAIRTKTKRMGKLKLMMVTTREAIDDIEKSFGQDKAFAAQLQKSCSTKSDDHAKETKTRQQELQAIAETIKILTDDSALDLFKKALPSSASNLIQMQSTVAKIRSLVSISLRRARSIDAGDRHKIDLILLALDSKKISFDVLISKIDALIKELEEEQDADTKKKVYCKAEFDSAEDKSRDLERSMADLTSEISSQKEGLAAVQEDLANLEKHIQELDKDIAEATEQRKEEHSAFMDKMAENTAAKELLTFAKQRLEQFYGAALTQTVQTQQDLAASSDFKSYKKKDVEAGGALSMISALIADVEKDMAVAKTEEQDAQADYEDLVREAQSKRATDSKAFMGKESTRADLKADLEDNSGEKKTTRKELMTHEEKIASLHKACDWILKNFDTRKEARSSEIENLKNSKLVLAGA